MNFLQPQSRDRLQQLPQTDSWLEYSKRVVSRVRGSSLLEQELDYSHESIESADCQSLIDRQKSEIWRKKVQYHYHASVSSSRRDRIEGLTERDESMTPGAIDEWSLSKAVKNGFSICFSGSGGVLWEKGSVFESLLESWTWEVLTLFGDWKFFSHGCSS